MQFRRGGREVGHERAVQRDRELIRCARADRFVVVRPFGEPITRFRDGGERAGHDLGPEPPPGRGTDQAGSRPAADSTSSISVSVLPIQTSPLTPGPPRAAAWGPRGPSASRL